MELKREEKPEIDLVALNGRVEEMMKEKPEIDREALRQQVEAMTKERPEIDRVALRGILLDSLPEGTVRWGCTLKKVGEDGTLQFEYGVESGFDLVIGSDGGWSKVRPVLSDLRPFYSGIGGFELVVNKAGKGYSEIARLAGRGSYFAFSDCKGL